MAGGGIEVVLLPEFTPDTSRLNVHEGGTDCLEVSEVEDDGEEDREELVEPQEDRLVAGDGQLRGEDVGPIDGVIEPRRSIGRNQVVGSLRGGAEGALERHGGGDDEG